MYSGSLPAHSYVKEFSVLIAAYSNQLDDNIVSYMRLKVCVQYSSRILYH